LFIELLPKRRLRQKNQPVSSSELHDGIVFLETIERLLKPIAINKHSLFFIPQTAYNTFSSVFTISINLIG